MRATLRLTLLLAGALCIAPAKAQVMKCVDANGRIEYAKSCAAGATEAARIQRNGTQVPGASQAAPAPVPPQKTTEPGPEELDGLELNICAAATRGGGEKGGPADVRYQAEYKRLTGGEFNTALCGDSQRRMARRVAWENKRRDERLQQQADDIVANEGEALRAICREKQAMASAAKKSEGTARADAVKDSQERSRVLYARLVASYERTHNKAFDPTRCP
ncbi:MAG TPA: DUF4124 domain-containing protein [Burkholderiales bacterium]|nr:DUF4124 domain-containing protein [Burkholderiales bacterium]